MGGRIFFYVHIQNIRVINKIVHAHTGENVMHDNTMLVMNIKSHSLCSVAHVLIFYILSDENLIRKLISLQVLYYLYFVRTQSAIVSHFHKIKLPKFS